jgi:hypothetical protein
MSKKTTTKKTKTKTADAAAPAAAAAPKAEPAKAQAAPAATPESVQARAHQIWVAKGKPVPGTPVADWLQAERELGVRKT